MTAAKVATEYCSGFCVHGRHDHCRGDFGTATCCCPCHDEPEPEPEPPPPPRIGSLFSGYGGLDGGVQSVLGGTVAWHSEIDPGACRILAHRYPDVPNLGDITAVDWAAVEPVDVLCGGFPCQDVSAAGKRAGIRPGTRSGLWSQFAYAIDQLRPRLVVIENVRGLLSADAHHPSHGNLEPCPWCLGDDEPVLLRALGAVLGDLAELGFDAEWVGLRAADVGAPHGRFRVFVAAWPAADSQGIPWGSQHGERLLAGRQGEGRGTAADTDRLGHERGRRARDGWTGPADGAVPAADADDLGRATQGAGRPGAELASASCDRGDAAADPHGDAVREQPVTVAGRGGSAVAGRAGADAAADTSRLGRPGCEQPRADMEQDGPQPAYAGAPGGAALDWGPHGPAIERWERRLGRPAPSPTEPGAKGQPRLAPAFVEWLMGLPAGWVTDVPGLTRNEQLKALGNGVVPQQAAAALRLLLASLEGSGTQDAA